MCRYSPADPVPVRLAQRALNLCFSREINSRPSFTFFSLSLSLSLFVYDCNSAPDFRSGRTLQRLASLCIEAGQDVCARAINVGQKRRRIKVSLLRGQGVNNYGLNTCLKHGQHPQLATRKNREGERQRVSDRESALHSE